MKCPFCIKKCSKCGELLVANLDRFSKDKKGKYGLRSQCKKCCVKYTQKKRENEEYRQAESEYNKQRYQANKEKIKLQSSQWKQNNSEYCKQYHQQYYQDNPEYFKQYYQDNKEQILERQYQYYQDNPDKAFNNAQKRRRLLKELNGNGYIEEQWLEMMNYFDWKCAYSGEDLYKRSSTDHIIPISKGGQNNIWNFVPMVRSYNSQKYNKTPLEWYQQQEFYSEERLNKIIEWQQYAYEKWGTEEWPLILITEA